ncbi:MAG: tRNA (guanosine(46)-N7)-methyltransferase TrmB [Bacteroidetes bacterium]|jgi:tRNA (guanine-N7-)-methyltransferase|nr:tRNA (guanosine(46)-N7)-methyltransferase TrmB [Bacteroidota bacterium]MBT6685661.1 tRNA (guanosine(46)-N7)-methyltransferase TrmB [Bacteroidota bacterium]MBT7141885.1 tRNA (guanosine(46)-N7)-methyltransferase TrmB [Bacteroidota bacterium]MBT7491038.1 tRNA (guanosine(46)-N7)-methyltransferase TrmB [Bacteroidota bacterium]
MAKRKLQRFADIKQFDNVVDIEISDILNQDFELKLLWKSKFFNNSNPIVLELACGKGEYTIGLAEKIPEKNFIGIDKKGARMWVGAKYALDNKLQNVAFIRTRIELLASFFGKNEVDEIWITFPDPQLKSSKKRLTSARFLNLYRNIIKPSSIIHLKTDSQELFDFTNKMIEFNKLNLLFSTNNVENANLFSDILSIKTNYENIFLEEGKKIKYLKFELNKEQKVIPFD